MDPIDLKSAGTWEKRLGIYRIGIKENDIAFLRTIFIEDLIETISEKAVSTRKEDIVPRCILQSDVSGEPASTVFVGLDKADGREISLNFLQGSRICLVAMIIYHNNLQVGALRNGIQATPEQVGCIVMRDDERVERAIP